MPITRVIDLRQLKPQRKRWFPLSAAPQKPLPFLMDAPGGSGVAMVSVAGLLNPPVVIYIKDDEPMPDQEPCDWW